jgi:quercetin dioxygenase-like cupin family protein
MNDASRRTRTAIATIAGLLLASIAVGGSVARAQDESNARPTVVMREGLAPTRTSPESTSQVTLFAEGENAWMGKLRLKPGATIAPETKPSETYLFVLRGEGSLTVGEQSKSLRPASGVYVPAERKVSYENGNRLMVALQFFTGPEAANEYSAWRVGELALTEGGKKQPRKTRRSNRKSTVHRRTQVKKAPNMAVEVAEIASGNRGWMGLLRVGAGATVSEYRNPTEEYLYVLRGEGTLIVDGTKYRLDAHTGIYIPPKATVSFENGSELFSAVQFFSGPESAQRYDEWTPGSPSLQPSAPKTSNQSSSGDMPSLKIGN